MSEQAEGTRKYKENGEDVYVEGPVGSATLETLSGWGIRFRFRKGDKYTEWGEYEHIYSLDGKVYVSPYWLSDDHWKECTPEEAVNYIARGEHTEDTYHEAE